MAASTNQNDTVDGVTRDARAPRAATGALIGLAAGYLWTVVSVANSAGDPLEILLAIAFASWLGALAGDVLPVIAPLFVSRRRAGARSSRVPLQELVQRAAVMSFVALALACVTTLTVSGLRDLGQPHLARLAAAVACSLAVFIVGRRLVRSTRLGRTKMCIASLLLASATIAWLPGHDLVRRIAAFDVASPNNASGAAGGAALHPGKALPNIVLIVLDTTRADHLSPYGYARDTTPFLSELAEESLLYERAISPAPWTLPAHASFFTGLLPSEHHTNSEHQRLDEGLVTTAEALQTAGYETVAFSSNPYISSNHNFHQGFDHFFEIFRGSPALVDRPFERLLPGPLEELIPERDASLDKGGQLLNRVVVHWLDERRERGERRPFFLFVNYIEAHLPYRAPARFRERFSANESAAAASALLGGDWYFEIFRRMGGGSGVSSAERTMLINFYDAGLAYQDELLRELVGNIDRHSPPDRTALVVTSDHGENLGEHDRLDHVFSVHQTLLEVPLLVRYPPAFAPGSRYAGLVSTASLHATLLELPGAAGAGELRPEGPALPRRANDTPAPFAISEEDLRLGEVATLTSEAPGADAARWLTRYRAIQDERWKLVERDDGTRELFDLLYDAGERNPLDPDGFRGGQSLQQTLDAWQAQRRPDLRDDPESPGDPDESRRLDPQIRESLRLLGYIL